MKLNKLTNKQQIMAGVLCGVIFLSVYTFARYLPQNTTISSLKAKAESTERKLKKARIPDEPIEDVSTLKAQLEDQLQAMDLIQSEASAIEASLAVFGSQELKVRISQLARESNVRIQVNELFKTQNQALLAANNNKNKKKKAKGTPLAMDLVLPETASWIDRMSEGTLFHRPMQRLELVGDFESIQRFIYGLDRLPWQTTIVRIKVTTSATESPYGYSQQLISELVLAL